MIQQSCPPFPIIAFHHGLDYNDSYSNDIVPPLGWGDTLSQLEAPQVVSTSPVASAIPDPPSYLAVRSTSARNWSLETITRKVDRLSEIMQISSKVNEQGDQIVEIEIDHDGNIEYPINLPVRQIYHSDLLNVSNEHNYAAIFSQLQDGGWDTPPVVSPRVGGSPFQSCTLRRTVVRNT